MPERVLAGVDIGGTKTAVVLSRRLPEVLTRHEFPTAPENGPQPAIREIIRGLREALHSIGAEGRDLKAIGVSCGNPLDAARGIIQAPPNLKTWVDVPICEILQKEFGSRCYLENDANAGALAEASFGAGKGVENFVFITMGTGFGAGLILNGELYRGASDAGGEIGHVRLTRNGPVGYGKAGSVEGWASGGGMAQVAATFVRAALKRGETTTLGPMLSADSSRITARDVAMAAKAGDRVAQAIILKVGRRLGQALAILIDVLNPDRIAIGGLAMRMGEDLLGPARKVVAAEALTASARACKILPAELGERIGDIASLCIAAAGLSHDNAVSAHQGLRQANRHTDGEKSGPDTAEHAGSTAS